MFESGDSEEEFALKYLDINPRNLSRIYSLKFVDIH